MAGSHLMLQIDRVVSHNSAYLALEFEAQSVMYTPAVVDVTSVRFLLAARFGGSAQLWDITRSRLGGDAGWRISDGRCSMPTMSCRPVTTSRIFAFGAVVYEMVTEA